MNKFRQYLYTSSTILYDGVLASVLIVGVAAVAYSFRGIGWFG